MNLRRALSLAISLNEILERPPYRKRKDFTRQMH